MMYQVKSGRINEDINGTLEDAIARMCELIKQHPGSFRVTDHEGRTHATGFPGDPSLWAADTFEFKGKTYGVACVRHYENQNSCPECGSPMPASMLGCPQCAFLKCPSNPAGKPRNRRPKPVDSGDTFNF